MSAQEERGRDWFAILDWLDTLDLFDWDGGFIVVLAIGFLFLLVAITKKVLEH